MSRNGLLTLAVALAFVLVCIIHLITGPSEIGLREWFSILISGTHHEAWQVVVATRIRLPRLLVGIAVGISLSLSGVLLQGIFRNPLAGPGVVGMSSGASLGAVFALFLGLANYSVWAIPLFAILGAISTGLIVYLISRKQGSLRLETVLLAGIALTSLNAALTSLIISLSLKNYTIGREILYWLLGGLDGRTWEHVLLSLPISFLGLGVSVRFYRNLDTMLLGERHAAAVGVDVPKTQFLCLGLAGVLTAAAVSVSGVIGFIGLVIPHTVRLLFGPKHFQLLLLSPLLGAATVLVADIVARRIISPEEMRLGVITALFGAPFFLYFLLKQKVN